MVQADLRNQCQNKLVRTDAVFFGSKAAAPIEKRLMAPSLQRGGNFFQPIVNREAIFWVLSSGKVFPELGIYCDDLCEVDFLRCRVHAKGVLYIYALSACIHECKHTLLQSYSFVSLFVKAFCRLHMPVLGVVVPSP